MTDFWLNHFNVYQYKDQCAYYTTAYERDVIRPHALGKFYDLLVATAQSPAMLMYLDNWVSIGPHSQAAGKSGPTGLNENYGREMMELHTLGVDGGYAESDVTELSAALTGWTIAQPDDGGQFQFDPRRHEPGIKTVPRREVCRSRKRPRPSRARHARASPLDGALHLEEYRHAVRLDDPPESLVKRMAATFLSTRRRHPRSPSHDVQVARILVTKGISAKLKTPLEFIVSAVRASGANVVVPDALVQNLNAMGMPAYGMAVPTGYPMKTETWQTTALCSRGINFSTATHAGGAPRRAIRSGDFVTVAILTSSDPHRTKAVLAHNDTGLDFATAIVEDAILHGELSRKAKSDH